MTSDLLPEIEDALDTWQEGLSQFMYGPAERQRLTAILRAKLFAFTRPAPALSALGGWNEAIEQIDEEQRTYYRDSGSEDYHKGYIMALAAMRRRFTALRRPAPPSRGEG